MAFRADETVPPFLFRVGGVYVHSLDIQHSKYFNNRKAAADVADTQMADAFERITADVSADLLQIPVQLFLPP